MSARRPKPERECDGVRLCCGDCPGGVASTVGRYGGG